MQFNSGGKLQFHFRSDSSTNEWGYKFKVLVIPSVAECLLCSYAFLFCIAGFRVGTSGDSIVLDVWLAVASVHVVWPVYQLWAHQSIRSVDKVSVCIMIFGQHFVVGSGCQVWCLSVWWWWRQKGDSPNCMEDSLQWRLSGLYCQVSLLRPPSTRGALQKLVPRFDHCKHTVNTVAKTFGEDLPPYNSDLPFAYK